MSARMDKVNSLITTEVGTALGRSAAANVLATVTGADTTSDLRETHVSVSVLPDTDEAWSAVESVRAVLQAHLAERLQTKRTPRLSLVRDHGQAHAQRVEELLRGDR